MKKYVAFGIILIIFGQIAYTSMDRQEETAQTESAIEKVELADGGTIQLTAQEANLEVEPGKEKAVFTGLGMF